MAKVNKKAQNSQGGFAETCGSIISSVISCTLLFLMIVFPLIYDNSYYNILETKYTCFYLTVLAMLAVILLLSLVMLIIDCNEFKGEHVRSLLSGLKPANWKMTFGVADMALLVFWLISIISTFQSNYVFESFWGNEGRFSGLFLMTLYIVTYFVISRLWKPKAWVFQAFLVGGLAVCFVGLTDYFQMDILHFRTHIKPEQSALFISTLGNINTYTAYVGIMMGAAAAMFATSKKWLSSIWYYVCMVVAFFAIITGCSDNAYLAIGALLAFLPFALFKNKDGVLRYLIILATFAAVIQCIDYVNQAYAGIVIELDSLFKILVNFGGLLYVVIALWTAVVVLYLYWYRKLEMQAGTQLVKIWGILVLLGVLAVVWMLIDANALGNGSRYGGIGHYLVFNDQWGTNRGYIWRKTWETYRDFPLIHRLFGYGPDTFGIITTNSFMREMSQVTGQVFDSPHNEYLQFLITIGPFGLIAYLAFQISAWVKMFKNMQKNPYIIASLAAVICYAFQALVNLIIPIATPFMWLLLGMGMAAARCDVKQDTK